MSKIRQNPLFTLTHLAMTTIRSWREVSLYNAV